ncbi:hypothetical protein F2Q70_00006511 [Brassica cretica]|uniref:Uncharacterized protein n=1 Tax=Brassica cretica TaxID=69181 RepID=A0A8S9IPI8_BRACR|nr:hypothetical protein F2Q70_00006511 [Brassica cretica]
MDQKELDQMRKVVKELMKELKAMAMARKTVDVESYIIKTKIKNIKEELDHKRKVVKELEMDHLICDLENGLRSLDDLSQTEASDVAPEGGPSSLPSDDNEDMKTREGESSKSGGADDA